MSANTSGSPGSGFRSTCAAVVVACTIVAAGCGGSDGDDAAPATAATTETTAPATTTTTATNTAAGLSGELVITRQRDLIDRGLINVLTTNDTGEAIRISDRRLVADHFDVPPAPPRLSMLGDGANVALQVPYGTATNCESDGPVTAELHITFTVDGSSEVQVAEVDLGGTDILDAIRAEQCAEQTFAASTEVRFYDVVVDDESVGANLVISNSEGEAPFVVERMFGTILVGTEPEVGALPIEVAAGSSATIPMEFVVIRCDPHALAEVTKRYGLDLTVSYDGQPAQPIAIDVTPLTDDLEVAVEQCRQRQT